jgi:hypothetical protein
MQRDSYPFVLLRRPADAPQRPEEELVPFRAQKGVVAFRLALPASGSS